VVLSSGKKNSLRSDTFSPAEKAPHTVPDLTRNVYFKQKNASPKAGVSMELNQKVRF
jgi:hypothetical protein